MPTSHASVSLNVSPPARLLGQTLLLIAVISLPGIQHPAYLVAGLLLAGLFFWQRVDGRAWFTRLRAALPFVLIVVVPAAMVRAMTTDDLSAWLHGGLLLVRVLLAVSLALLMVTALSFTEFRGGLRSLGMPAVIVESLALAYRYLDVLADERVRLQRAMAAAGRTPRSLLHAPLLGRLTGSLFLRSIERAERIHHAMLAAGGGTTTDQTRQRWSMLDAGFVLACSLAGVLLVGWAR